MAKRKPLGCYTLNGQEKASWLLRVYTLDGKRKPLGLQDMHPQQPRVFSWPLKVYTSTTKRV
jgi:hypothetical protein